MAKRLIVTQEYAGSNPVPHPNLAIIPTMNPQTDVGILYAMLGQSLRALQDAEYKSAILIKISSGLLGDLCAALDDEVEANYDDVIPHPAELKKRPAHYLAPNGELKPLRSRKLTGVAVTDEIQDLLRLDLNHVWYAIPREELSYIRSGKKILISQRTLQLVQKARACKPLTAREEVLVNHPDLFEDGKLRSYGREEIMDARALVIALRGGSGSSD